MSEAAPAGAGKAGTKQVLFTADATFVEGEPRPDWGVLVEGGEIVAVGPRRELDRPEVAIMPFPGRALLPGCVNAHAHSFQSLLRGVGDDLPFDRWRAESLFRFAPGLSPDAVHAGALLAFSEMLLHGVTTVCDFFYLHHDGNEHDRQVIRAAQALGIRLVLARAFYDWQEGPRAFREAPARAAERFAELRRELADERRVSVLPAPHSLHAASAEAIRAGAACAAEAGVPWHIHVAEEKSHVEAARARFGATPARALDKLGVLDDRAVLVHAIWLDAKERALLAERGVKVVHNPGANMFLGDGVCDVVDLLARGVTVALGTDGGCTNSRVSIYDEMRACALLQKVQRLDGAALSAEQAFAAGTAGGAAAVGQPVGRLAPGCRADFTLLELDDLSLHPLSGLKKNVVYALSHRAVHDVVVEGEVVVRDRQLVKLPLATVRERVREAVKTLG